MACKWWGACPSTQMLLPALTLPLMFSFFLILTFQGRGEFLYHRAQGWALLFPNSLCTDSPSPEENKQAWEYDCGFQQLGRENQGEEKNLFINVSGGNHIVGSAVLLVTLFQRVKRILS